MLLLTQKEIKKILPLSQIKKVINAIEKAFQDFAEGKAEMPPKMYLNFREFEGDLRIMPSFSKTLLLAGTKLVNVHPQNPKRNLPTVMAIIILHDPKTGIPLTVMDGTWITAMRTGAAAAVATKYLARKEAKTLGVIGAGTQAITQIAAISKVRRLKEILVYDIKEENVERLIKTLAKEKIKVKKAKDLIEACKNDILVTATPVREPIVKSEWILPGTHINAIGADAKGKEELDPEILKRAKIVVDCLEQAAHSGEINVPLEKGIIKKEDIFAELGEVVSGKKPGRTKEDEITIFDSTGLAIQDLYTGALIYKIAKRKKLGLEIEII